MNKKVLKTMIALVVIFLVALYVLKIFFPEEFVMAMENDAFVTIGNYIDSHKWSAILVGFIIGFVGDYLYFGAVCRQAKLKLSLILIISVYGLAFILFYFLAPQDLIIKSSNIIVAIQSCYMILVPLLYTKELKPLAVTYCITSIAQLLSLSIRNLAILITNANTITNFFMCFESYLWLLLLFSLFNYNKRRKDEWELLDHTTE